jgi:hypothetical protein
VVTIKRRPNTNFLAVAGRVIFVGDQRVNGVGLYDTVSRTWSALPGLNVPGDINALTWSTDGTKLYIGGQANMFGSNSFIMYDSALQTVTTYGLNLQIVSLATGNNGTQDFIFIGTQSSALRRLTTPSTLETIALPAANTNIRSISV